MYFLCDDRKYWCILVCHSLVHEQVNDRLQYIQTQIKQGEKKIELKEIPLGDTYCYGLDVYNPAWVWRYKMYYNIPGDIELKFPER